jgi:hypothetical protein
MAAPNAATKAVARRSAGCRIIAQNEILARWRKFRVRKTTEPERRDRSAWLIDRSEPEERRLKERRLFSIQAERMVGHSLWWKRSQPAWQQNDR